MTTKFLICPYDECGRRVRLEEPIASGNHEGVCALGHLVWILKSEGRTIVVERHEPIRETPGF
ncbi:MAG: hypothetical protein ABI592_07355 [Acidobacteriota bacterium]